MEKRREINKSRRRKRSKGVNRLEIEVFDNWPIIKNFNRPERGYSDRFLGKKEIISAKMLRFFLWIKGDERKALFRTR